MANDNANDNAAGRDLLRVMARLTALEVIMKMIAGNAFGRLSNEDARAWADDVLSYLGDIQPGREPEPDELLVWVAIKTEAVASGARLLKGALEVAARIRAERDQD
ncbi:hypothetical protein [Reyranella sp.]|jgi:hypothetical protein|uniref:hypothetical protein n=1 Tax=Reyranella sp. TaxID=1929291 RepID=UPI000BCC326D|nr:hypothetical protein [Reyranella sp.]OYY40454.1 MAG: hypothetical protein B7Y57_17240 [Rhodospirillales bacterium 35-66-84]OYZ93071.1 MAG: hypothetical protein B7Y08_18490 [Rhodospirillales bacterium 24-66-33]OZB24199.1 MAG: hypothetical protein B7X63_16450 [Rhodospirillales bacterium 39-66-50]HQS18793.1 hypothetical protein [Reyranella sp.]HQT14897.1 hypothetical protein [Reyranella sp.]